MVENPDFQATEGNHQASKPQKAETREGELHLRFFVAEGSEFALPATGIRRIIQHAPDYITPVPNVSPLLLGTLNQQGQVIWVADLGQFLGCAKLMNTDCAEIPVIAVEEQGIVLGLAVDKVVGTDWLDPESLKATTNPSDGMAPFLKGEWLLGSGSPLKLLDHVAILHSARWVA
ncbi:hypothetical protein S7335_3078 [Synechococcus sp. PCC 7335]|uniref:CheW domain-containing protein n=1 Tax=Synechococcus sp. (strain ATCC 29403 / PCC 7335) TaxID=91464 RepID=UPI00017ECB07|nr:CheW domain-containing protein [Synechococcus sp. PCC 7335]EDX85377.1 hypothetical protein S7335_3078 [Synechococcus sp. PCC 7335]